MLQQAQVPTQPRLAPLQRHRQQALHPATRRSGACTRHWRGVQAHRQLAPLAAAAAAAQAAATASADVEVDVCVLGAGIIGLCTSLALLRADPRLRVALVDAAQPCAGATGAGQGYLWLAHRDPASPAWQLAVRSRQMWQDLLAPTVPQLTQVAVEWQVQHAQGMHRPALGVDRKPRTPGVWEGASSCLISARCLPAMPPFCRRWGAC